MMKACKQPRHEPTGIDGVGAITLIGRLRTRAKPKYLSSFDPIDPRNAQAR